MKFGIEYVNNNNPNNGNRTSAVLHHGDVFPSDSLKFRILSVPNPYVLCNTKEYSPLNKSG